MYLLGDCISLVDYVNDLLVAKVAYDKDRNINMMLEYKTSLLSFGSFLSSLMWKRLPFCESCLYVSLYHLNC